MIIMIYSMIIAGKAGDWRSQGCDCVDTQNKIDQVVS